MRLYLLLLFIAMPSCLSFITEKAIKEKFEAFKIKYGKKYSFVEEQHSLKKFAKSLIQVERHNLEAAKGLHSYKIGINKFSDLSDGDFKDKMLSGLNPQENEFLGENCKTLSDEDPPEYVNWVEKGYVTEVKDQGNCSACWAFAAVGVIEGQVVKSGGKLQSYSVQDLVDCSFLDTRYPWWPGCFGGQYTDSFNYTNHYGIDTELQYPYTGKDNPKCNRKPPNVKTKHICSVAPGEGNLEEALSKVGPIAVAIIPDPIKSYESGIFDGKCEGKADHAVLVVGYGKDDGKDFWLVKNSWGKDWGEAGYIRMARNQGNICKIADKGAYTEIDK